MKARFATFFVLAAALLVLSASLSAHHGSSAYDDKHPITISGTVTEFVWSNPHCQIYVDVKDSKDQVTNWAVETNSPGILTRGGWSRTSLKPGDKVSITLVPAKSGAPVGYTGGAFPACKIVFADGRALPFDYASQDAGKSNK
jgi:hypothetical protein